MALSPAFTLSFANKQIPICLPLLTLPTLASLKTTCRGHAELQSIGLFAIALGWPAEEPLPWAALEEAALKEADGKLKMYEAEMKGRGAQLSPQERLELQRDLKQARGAFTEAKELIQGLRPTDVPLNPAEIQRVAQWVLEGFLTAGVPLFGIVTWATKLLKAIDDQAMAGFSEWIALEEAGFSIPPVDNSSAGGLQSQENTAEIPSDG